MKLQFSAGGVVLRQLFDSEVAQTRGAQDFGSKPQLSKKMLEVLVCQHSQHHGWVFPKGLIGDHPSINSGQGRKETKEETALREVKEETGVKAKIIKALTPVVYWFKFENETIKKTVYYFLMEYVGGDITKHDLEMENVEWLLVKEVEKRLTYKSDKKVWQEVKNLL